MEAVEWEQVGAFVVSDVERPLTRKRRRRRTRAVTGPRAVRVPVGADEQRAFAPCAYVGPGPALTLALYEDPEAGRLLCSVDAVTSLGAEGGDTRNKPRTLEWRADDKVEPPPGHWLPSSTRRADLRLAGRVGVEQGDLGLVDARVGDPLDHLDQLAVVVGLEGREEALPAVQQQHPRQPVLRGGVRCSAALDAPSMASICCRRLISISSRSMRNVTVQEIQAVNR
ncbi:hypothetical protein J7F03_30530 [Streptomyces sp. ISL-43]|nr:hypothetical protein [Streptomyces sp. ISL-43]